MKALHAGYVSAAVWNAIRHDKLSAELDWQDILNRLSHFVIDGDVGGDNKLSPALCILENIFCRGLPTFPSLYIEKELERLTGVFKCDVAGNTTISAYECKINPDVAASTYPLLEIALCAASPEGTLTP